ncbi:MAG: hypothetical protein IJ886_07905 [Prevotella sp.]|nr:hypothetical protein [Prevotella sp.]MBR2230173.1 hypothetical protein [Prevotella sp.]
MAKVQELFDYPRLNNLNIIEVVRRLGVDFQKAGVNYKMNCPWHDDEHPSLVLYNKENDMHCHCYTCGAHHSVIDLVMALENWTFKKACQWLSNEFGISTLTASGYVAQPVPQPKQKLVEKRTIKEYTYIPMAMVDNLVSTENSLCRCLMYMAHSKAAPWTPQAVEWTIDEYCIGNYALWNYDDYTVFPNIDFQGRVCNLKVQHYDTDPASPRFGHDNIGQSYWLGSMWLNDGMLNIKEGKQKEKVVFRNDSLFGEHLLSRYPNTTVALVESPKNALFGALAYPEMVWVAAGNKTNLKRSVLKPLQGRNVYVYPDRDAITLWSDTLSGMKDLANFAVSDFCLRHAPEDQLKFDIADYLQQKWQEDI